MTDIRGFEPFSEEALLRGFDDAYQQTVFYLVKFGCTGHALDAFQSDIEMGGLITAVNVDRYKEGEFSRLKDSQNSGDVSIFTDKVTSYAELFQSAIADKETSVDHEDIIGLALRHQMLIAHSYYLP